MDVFLPTKMSTIDMITQNPKYEAFRTDGNDVIWTFRIVDLTGNPSFFDRGSDGLTLKEDFYEFLSEHDLYDQFKAPFMHKKNQNETAYICDSGITEIRMSNDVFLLLKLTFL